MDRVYASRFFHWVGVGIAGLGLGLLVLGTFLPWLRSGDVLRDSYQASSAVGRIAGLNDGPIGFALAVWPGIALIATLCVVGYVCGLRRSAAVANVLLAAIVGTVGGFAAQYARDDSAIGLVATGPTVTLIGAALGILGGIAVLVFPITTASTQQENRT